MRTIAKEVAAGKDLTGKRAIVTGGASGIGVPTAMALAANGAEVTMAVRNLEAGKKIAGEISAATSNSQAFAVALDQSNTNSIDQFIAGWKGPLHFLINNGGVMAGPILQQTAEGREMQFAITTLGILN
jgi:NAD(P)-dependent dehydrogenase (short-subunit alcohol dehydrogenase family)